MCWCTFHHCLVVLITPWWDPLHALNADARLHSFFWHICTSAHSERYVMLSVIYWRERQQERAKQTHLTCGWQQRPSTFDRALHTTSTPIYLSILFFSCLVVYVPRGPIFCASFLSCQPPSFSPHVVSPHQIFIYQKQVSSNTNSLFIIIEASVTVV